MAIGRVEHVDGEFLSALNGGYTDRMNFFLRRDLGNLVILNPGTRLITPRPWTVRTNEHFLVVNEDGTGEYHKVPRKSFGKNPSLDMLMGLSGGELRHTRGDEAVLLSAESNATHIPLVGPHPDHRDIRLWSITAYVPEDVAAQMPHESIEPPRA